MSNTLVVGSTIQNRYAGLGGTTGFSRKSVAKLFSFFFSFPGEGKSAFVQSNPDAFVINLDLTTTVTPTPHCVMWPAMRDGIPVNDLGKATPLTYELLDELLGKLRDLAIKDQPRPATIVFDSASAWQGLVMDHVANNAQKYNISKTELANIAEGNKVALYGVAYDLMRNTCLELKSLGYGICLLGHIAKSRIPHGPDAGKMEVTFAFGHGLFKRLAPEIDLAALVTSSLVARQVQSTTNTTIVSTGQVIPVTTYETVTEKQVTLTCTDANFAGMTKARVSFPPLVLPIANSWQVFEAHYRKYEELALFPKESPS